MATFISHHTETSSSDPNPIKNKQGSDHYTLILLPELYAKDSVFTIRVMYLE